ncbi:hypothetical protein ACFS5N_05880 [Mucilaginibacter ximonensis]|uniref:Uncharacterized protein n=1 Tax=Mucilaginibacter ximonensis TaxID=538021 RepID=A0ABW5Y9K2_9SPHI
MNDLCGNITYGFGAFNSGDATVRVVATDVNMVNTKVYHPFIVQTVTSGIVQYDAPAITITY